MSNDEILRALKGIGSLTTPGTDAYGAKFFKETWAITKNDILDAVNELFEKGKMYKAINNTLLTIIPKSNVIRMVRDYRIISCYTIIYKIISKFMTSRHGKVLNSIIHQSQVAFVTRQHIHDHILLAYELIKSYNTIGGAPRCMLQIDLQKSHDTIE